MHNLSMQERNVTLLHGQQVQIIDPGTADPSCSSVSHIYSPGCTVFAGNWTSMDPSLCWHPGPVTSSKKAAGFRSLQG